jgi:hypothetical protein
VRLVHDHQLRRPQQELVLVPLVLDKVNANDLHGVVLVHRAARRQAPFQLRHGARPHHDGFQVEFLLKLLLPLVAQVWRAQDREPPDLPSLPQLPGDGGSLDGLSHAHVVRDEQPDRVQAEGEHEGHRLVRSGTHGDATEGREGRSVLPEQQATGLPQEVDALGVRHGPWVQQGEGRRRNPLRRNAVAQKVAQHPVDRHHVVTGAGEGP